MTEKNTPTNRKEELCNMIVQLDDVEARAMLILVNSMRAGEPHTEAAEKAAAFFEENGRSRQAQAVRDTAKTFAEGARI